MPYPNEHACRLNNPDKYSKMFRKNGERSHNGKSYDVIYGVKKDGKSEEQAYRYPKSSWDEGAARSHCSSHNGSFEPAKKGTSSMTYLEELKWAILPHALTDILNKAEDNIEVFFDVK